MLQLIDEFTLSYAFNKIPENQLVIPQDCVQRLLRKIGNLPKPILDLKYKFLDGCDGTQDIRLSLNSSGLSMVGHERDGVILISRVAYNPDAKDVVTFIDSFHIRELRLQTVYKHIDVIVCVACAVNFDSTLIAFTTKNRREVPTTKRARPTSLTILPSALLMVPPCTPPTSRSSSGSTSPKSSSSSSLPVVPEHDDSGNTLGVGSAAWSFRRGTSLSVVPSVLNSPGTLHVHNPGSVYTDFYESAVTEIKGKRPKCYTFNKSTDELQLVQFINPSERRRVGGKRVDVICYFYSRKFGMYEIFTQEITQKGIPSIKIVDHPNGKEILDSLVWYQWVPQKPLLYAIERTKSTTAIHMSKENDFLSCYSFPQKSGNSVANLVFKTQVPPVGQGDKITVVKLGSGDDANVILCTQHARTSQNSWLSVSLCMLPHDCLLHLRIPLINHHTAFQQDRQTNGQDNTNCELPTITTPEDEKEMAVFFDSMGDLLLIYVPGHYFQLINCSPDEEPQLSLCFSGSDFATPLPRQLEDPNSVVDIVPFTTKSQFLMSTLGSLQESNYQGTRIHAFFDNVSGTLYRYQFNREAILRIFSQNYSQFYLQGLNLAAVHMQDYELVEEIILQVCKYNSLNGTSDFFKEYLLVTKDFSS